MLITIIIATYNRCDSLKDTLFSLMKQTVFDGSEFEIIIADNNSNDNTRKLVFDYKNEFKEKLNYLFVQKQGKSIALNKAIEEARGDIIAFLDDDVIVEKDWLKNVAKSYLEFNFDAAGGKILPIYPKNAPLWVKKFRDILSGPISLYDHGAFPIPYNDSIPAFFGANLIIKTCCIKRFKFRTDFGPNQAKTGEDTDLFYRLKSNGKKIYYLGNAIVLHKVNPKPMNYLGLARWYIASGRHCASLEKEKSLSETICLLGIPRYLFKKVLYQFFLSIFTFFISKERFLRLWKATFVNLGRIIEYRNS